MSIEENGTYRKRRKTRNVVAEKAAISVEPKSLPFILSCLACLIAMIALGLAVFDYYKQPKLVAFDLKGTTDSFLQQLQKSSLNEEGKAQTIKRYEKVLQQVVADYETENIIILVKPAVVSNLPDKTSEIRKKIAQRMK